MFKNHKIKLIATDFDGIMTDGGVCFSSVSSEEIKKVNFKDIMGMSLAVQNDYIVAIISGEKNKIIDTVAAKFNLEDVHQGVKDKLSVIKSLALKYNLKPEEICYLGDDINDITALEYVKYAICVPDANYKVKEIAGIYITNASGGNGAYREIIDLIINN
ncbi:MAG: HAD hydrolase family protein [Candidatus Gastranaerophilales bacterium]|nr:HAD hydrolase family protein [Candidatus Gastranaerophilales bacterium]